MTDDQHAEIIKRICKQTTQLAQMLADIKGEIAVLSTFTVDAAVACGADRAKLEARLKQLHQQKENLLCEWPPPDVDDDFETGGDP